MIYKVMTVEETKTSTGKPMYKITLLGENGEEKLNIFDKVEINQELEGEIYVNDKGYKNFKSAQKVAGATFAMKQKNEVFEKAQERKEKSIATAQERNEIMWARYGATDIIAHHPAYSFHQEKDIPNAITELANKILAGEIYPF